ncbi:Calcium-dependent lipid-binding family protein [Perilla frutescens var. hirtella]|uniref:Calcium-dependent lipid-binding family protein n=1 Tax=Perilla frutescens var. hirtella TaxID=608512 RepID=A0AAD4P1K6_PERFH|nr:Calcium-dependent lipid-binding family protein [Perilla frutescens var. frutescens]KAH6822702.1 Calcium-dependent lipid-binding family protein [Perilla frutescens var. hirtella]
MDSPQSVVSPLKSSFPESEKQHSNLCADKPSLLSREIDFQRKETAVGNLEEFLGALEVYIHQARDIHNICIYQKQDVYAKLCVTSDPEKTVSTKIINGGGANPVFNENLSLNVRKVDSSLKCEIWMLSRVRNYLEDQLLGFTLVPISEVLLQNGKLEKEFSLSSTDLFHSPAGFVQLSVSYIGAQPEVIPIPAPPTSVETDSITKDTESIKSVPDDMDKIEFPDPKVANENDQMVEEYFGMPCSNVDSPSSDSLVSSDTENQVSSEVDVQNGESFSMGDGISRPSQKIDSPPSSASTNGISSASAPVSFQSSETPKDSKSPSEELVSPPKDKSKEKSANGLEADSNASGGVSGDTFAKPVVAVNIEPESKVVQQDIVDMYMKSMQQFTESLAKMKLPMDFEHGPTSSENSTSSEQKTPGSKNSGSRVFYGSRAFF